MIDVTKISKTDGKLLATPLLPILQKFYENPENEIKFQEWLAKRNEKLAS